MEIVKGLRAPERVYRIILWIVSFVFAAFIIGLGNLIIGDSPIVDEHIVQFSSTAENAQQKNINQQIRQTRSRVDTIDDKLDIARLQLDHAKLASNSARETFGAWIAARTATTNPDQDPEVLARTRELEQLKANERILETRIAELEQQRIESDQEINQFSARAEAAKLAEAPAREKARFQQELRIFGLRLLITLPLLLIAAWMILKKRASDYWPLMRGFVIAAVFVFFVELVPYMPSYGGYIRYLVGIVITICAGHFLVKNMRSYLARRQADEAKAEVERRRRVSNDEAFKKMASKCCPGCDRPISTTGEAEANFCVHCGMTLFNHCSSCDTRKMAFFRYCMTCGSPEEEASAKATDSPPHIHSHDHTHGTENGSPAPSAS